MSKPVVVGMLNYRKRCPRIDFALSSLMKNKYQFECMCLPKMDSDGRHPWPFKN